MEIVVRGAGRGRPLKIDTEKELESFMRSLPKAKARLQEIRKETSGQRDEAILGSETTLPKAVAITADVLRSLEQGVEIDYQTAKELKANIRTVKQLASKQERVYGRALASSLLSQYERDIRQASKYASKFSSQTYTRMLNRVKALTAKQQQSFFLSRGYQDPKTGNKEYRRVIEWAENDILSKTGESVSLTAEEALAYVYEQKQIEELERL